MDDHRLYVIALGWRVEIKPDDGKQLYCFYKEEGEESYPRIARGELYVTNDIEVYNLNAALKHQILSTERPRLGQPPNPQPSE